MSGTTLDMRNKKISKILKTREGSQDIECFIKWWIPSSLPIAWVCQTKLWVLNFEATSNISFRSDLKKARQEEKCRTKSRNEETFTGAQQYFISSGRQWNGSDVVSHKEKFYWHHEFFSHSSASSSQKQWKKIVVEVTKKMEEILTG